MGLTLISLNVNRIRNEHSPQKGIVSQERRGLNMLKVGRCRSSVLKDDAIVFSVVFLHLKVTRDLCQALMLILLVLDLKDPAHILMAWNLLLYKPKDRSVGSCMCQDQLLESSLGFVTLTLRKVEWVRPYWKWIWIFSCPLCNRIVSR